MSPHSRAASVRPWQAGRQPAFADDVGQLPQRRLVRAPRAVVLPEGLPQARLGLRRAAALSAQPTVTAGQAQLHLSTAGDRLGAQQWGHSHAWTGLPRPAGSLAA